MRNRLPAVIFLVLAACAVAGMAIAGASSLAAQFGSQVVTEPQPRRVSTGPGDFPFDVTRHTIDIEEIRGGGPPKNGIPALVEPSFVSSAEAGPLRSGDIVLGVSLGGVSKAYPIRILNWHELVNDRIGDRPILVSW